MSDIEIYSSPASVNPKSKSKLSLCTKIDETTSFDCWTLTHTFHHIPLYVCMFKTEQTHCVQFEHCITRLIWYTMKSELSPANQMWFGISIINYHYQELWEFYWCQIVRSKSHVNITSSVQFSYAHSLQLSVFGWFEWKLLMALWAMPWSRCVNASVRYSWTVDYFTSVTIPPSNSITVTPLFAPLPTHYWMDLFEYGCACLWFKCNHFICKIPCLSVTEIPNTE